MQRSITAIFCDPWPWPWPFNMSFYDSSWNICTSSLAIRVASVFEISHRKKQTDTQTNGDKNLTAPLPSAWATTVMQLQHFYSHQHQFESHHSAGWWLCRQNIQYVENNSATDATSAAKRFETAGSCFDQRPRERPNLPVLSVQKMTS